VPNIELSPVRDGKNANAFAFVEAAIKQRPKLGALTFGIPAVLTVTKRKNALFGSALFFIAAATAKAGIELMPSAMPLSLTCTKTLSPRRSRRRSRKSPIS
jgi:hypothetical protein